MKATVAPFGTRTYCVRIETVSGLVVRLTSHPRDLTMGANTYLSQSGYEFTGRSEGTGTSPGVMDLQGVADIAGIDRDALASGVFDNARLYVFATDYTAPAEDQEPIGAAILGKARLEDERYVIEMMSLIDALNQSVGKTYTPGCPKKFGGQEYAGCKVNLAPITVTGTITHVTSSAIVRDSARGEPADWFGAGTIRYTSGPNAGLKPMEIKRYEADGTIETFEPAYYAPSVGDAYEMIPGCRKRRAEDCRDKWSNVINFGGFGDVPTSSTYSQVGSK